MIEKLSPATRRDALAPLLAAGWKEAMKRDALEKTFVFRDFIHAFGWMTQVAIYAEKLAHHPEWCNVYRTVDVVLITHDVDGLTDLDLRLARKMDDLAG